MKRYILIGACSFLMACSDFDKKVQTDDYRQMLNRIESSGTEYNRADFIKASELANKYAVEAALSDELNDLILNITYKELLEEAKVANRKDTMEVQKYRKQMNQMKKLITPQIIEYQCSDNLYNTARFKDEGFWLRVEFKNNTAKSISGFEGYLVIKNKNGGHLAKSYIKEAKSGLLQAKKSIEVIDKNIFKDDDNRAELKKLKAEDLEIEWIPQIISFDNGKTIQLEPLPKHLIAPISE